LRQNAQEQKIERLTEALSQVKTVLKQCLFDKMNLKYVQEKYLSLSLTYFSAKFILSFVAFNV